MNYEEEKSTQIVKVKRALVASAVRDLAERMKIPERVCMTVVQQHNWSVAEAEDYIVSAIYRVAQDIKNETLGAYSTAGGAGGGKSLLHGNENPVPNSTIDLSFAGYVRVCNSLDRVIDRRVVT